MKIQLVLLMVVPVLLALLQPAGAGDIPNECRIGGFYLGPQAYSFRLYTFFEAVDKAKKQAAA